MLNLTMFEIDASMQDLLVEAIEIVNEDISKFNSSRDYKQVLTNLKLDFDWLDMVMDAKDINEYKLNFICQAEAVNRFEFDDMKVVNHEIKPKLDKASTTRDLKKIFDTYWMYVIEG